MSTAQERAAALEAEAAALDVKVSEMSREVFGMESKIKAAILEDEQRAKQLVRQRAKLGEEIDLFRFKSAALRDQVKELRVAVLREKLDEARALFAEKGEAVTKAVARLDLAKSELEQATRERDILTSHWSNAGAIVSKIEGELQSTQSANAV